MPCIRNGRIVIRLRLGSNRRGEAVYEPYFGITDDNTMRAVAMSVALLGVSCRSYDSRGTGR